jgi:hypothetical protein
MAIAHIGAVYAVAIGTRKTVRRTLRLGGAVRFIRAISAIVDVIAPLCFVDAPTIHTEEVLLRTETRKAVVGIFIRSVRAVCFGVAGIVQWDAFSVSALEVIRRFAGFAVSCFFWHALCGVVLAWLLY